MANQNNSHKATNFWFGFSLGILTSGTAIYLFGTKNGRQTLRNLLELTENLEENIVNLADELEEISFGDNEESSKTKKIASTIGTILDKVKSFSPLSK